MFHCYILQSAKSERFYVGHAQDLEIRLSEHNSGKVVSTRNKGPWTLIHSEPFSTRSDAMKREIEIKRWKSAAKIRERVGLERPENREGR